MRQFVAFLLLVNPSWAATHYIAASGADTNNGTAKGTPWAHAPGMPNCANNCAAYTPAPGDLLIFKGGDTWHFGNSGATPYTGGTWNWTFNGSAGNVIYVGVDLTWFTGGSFTRPILNADNPLSTGEVGSCTFQTAGGSNDLWVSSAKHFITLDNFEMLGICNQRTSQINDDDTYIVDGSSHDMTFSNLYIHGWTNTTFGCTTGGSCISIVVFAGGAGGGAQTNDVYDHILVDGSDSDPQGAIFVNFEGMYQVQYSYITNISQAVFELSCFLHDTVFDHFYFRPPNNGHDNMWEANALQNAGTTCASYNNVFTNIYPSGSAGNVVVWPAPNPGDTQYWFNNVGSLINGGGNYFNIGQNGQDQGTLVIFNNTFEAKDNVNVLNCQSTNSHVFTDANNHFITNSSSAYSSPCTGKTSATPLLQSHTTATGQGYNSSQTFPWSPTALSNSTVGAGTNEQSLCTALSSAGLSAAATACQSDTTFACSENTGTHTLTCPARVAVARPASAPWDIGAYQFSNVPLDMSFTGLNFSNGITITQ